MIDVMIDILSIRFTDQWYWILRIIGVIAVITNAMIMAWTSKSMSKVISGDRFTKLAVIMVVEVE